MNRTSLIEQVPLAMATALLMAGSTAFFLLAMPIALIEGAVLASGMPAVLASAAPPLGATGRLLIVGTGATAMGGLTWIAIAQAGSLLQPCRGKARPARKSPSPRRADAHPDAPARKPIFAASDFAIPIEPKQPIAAAWTELARYEADDTLELVDVVPDDDVTSAVAEMREAEPIAGSAEQPSIAELMARLEAGAERRAAKAGLRTESVTPAPPRGDALDNAILEALDELQRMAAR